MDELADHIHMSRRSFARLFAEQARTTPAEFVENARLDAARNLLEGSRLALKEIAFECGFGTPHRMRQVFLRRLSAPPGQYRASFQQMEELSTLSLAGGGMLVATAVLPGSMCKVLEERGDCIARIWGAQLRANKKAPTEGGPNFKIPLAYMLDAALRLATLRSAIQPEAGATTLPQARQGRSTPSNPLVEVYRPGN